MRKAPGGSATPIFVRPTPAQVLDIAKKCFEQAPWMAIWPGLAIFALVLAFNLLGDGLRDALDPRQR